MNKSGFTLIEVIVSIAILGILAVTFIPILSSQYVSIVGTGKKTTATYSAVEEVEKKIKDSDSYADFDDKTLKIKFTNIEKSIDIDVKEISVESKDKTNEKSTTIKVGIPNLP